MNLYDIYQQEGLAGLKRLAEQVAPDRRGRRPDPQYLRQCATRWHGKQPSPDLSRRLIAADPRLTMADLYAEPAPTREAA